MISQSPRRTNLQKHCTCTLCAALHNPLGSRSDSENWALSQPYAAAERRGGARELLVGRAERDQPTGPSTCRTRMRLRRNPELF